jgi:hypothetical protein
MLLRIYPPELEDTMQNENVKLLSHRACDLEKAIYARG